MYNALVIAAFLIVLALMLVHWKPKMLPGIEPFAVAAVDPVRMPACAARSPQAQALLARFATIPESANMTGSYDTATPSVEGADPDSAASELRLLISKLCCIEADIMTPAAGTYRTAQLQFRTSHDMEPASTLVGRCLAGAVQPRDVELIMDKFNKRGAELIKSVLGGCPEAAAEFAAVSNTTRAALASCCRPVPTMDHPLGARDLGFWEPARVADLSQYQGISAAQK